MHNPCRAPPFPSPPHPPGSTLSVLLEGNEPRKRYAVARCTYGELTDNVWDINAEATMQLPASEE